MLYSGKEFKKKYGDDFCRSVNTESNGFPWKEGVNYDPTFTSSHHHGGLYFIPRSAWGDWHTFSKRKIFKYARITIRDHALVHVEQVDDRLKFKSNEVFVLFITDKYVDDPIDPKIFDYQLGVMLSALPVIAFLYIAPIIWIALLTVAYTLWKKNITKIDSLICVVINTIACFVALIKLK